ncbi:hypothetical protein [Nocardioides sediminis]|uniref:hypothetical protein n=1 Tax=Nocardioides sediminis TaxID=433648 RepID=UPI000D30BAC0|nr:hypothetical protein [Nocardioides sediminis]
MATLRPGQSLDHLLTEDDHGSMQRALDAEARGEARLAWEEHMSGLVVEEALTHHRLFELANLGDEAPAWMCSRWAVDQAVRWMLMTEDPRCDDVVRTILVALHFSRIEPVLDDPTALNECGTAVAASD